MLIGEYEGLHLYDDRETRPEVLARFTKYMEGEPLIEVLSRGHNKLFRKDYLLLRLGFVEGGQAVALRKNWRNQVIEEAAELYDWLKVVPAIKCPIIGCAEKIVPALQFCRAHRRRCPKELRGQPQAVAIVQASADAAEARKKAAAAKRNAKEHARGQAIFNDGKKQTTRLFSAPGEP